MSTTLTKRASNQFNYVDALGATVAANREKLERGLHEALGSKEKAARVTRGVETVIEAAERARERYQEHLLSVDGEQDEDQGAREKLERAQEDLVAALRRARASIEGVVGAPALHRFALQHTPPATSREALAHYADAAVTRLTASSKKLDNEFGVSLDTAQVGDALRQRFELFEETKDALKQETRQTQAERDDRDEAEASFQRLLVNAARMLEGALRLAELDHAADRVRPTHTKASGEEPLPQSDTDTP